MSANRKIIGLTVGALAIAAYQERDRPDVKRAFRLAGQVLKDHLYDQTPAQLHSQRTQGYILGALNGAKEKAGLAANRSTKRYYLKTLNSVLYNESRAQRLWDEILKALDEESEDFFAGLRQGLADYRARPSGTRPDLTDS